MSNTVNEAVARPLRGAAQSATAVTIIEFVDVFFYDMDERGYTAAVVLLALALSSLQAFVENRTGKAFLRHVPSRGVPVTDDDEVGARRVDTGHL